MACKYKDIFGKPGKGVHEFHVGNVAVVDTLLTLIVAFGFSYFSRIPFTVSIIFLLVLAIFLHWIFCVKSSVNLFLGLV